MADQDPQNYMRSPLCYAFEAGDGGDMRRNTNSRPRPDPAPAMEWLRLHRKEYGSEWVALDGSRLIAHGPDAMEVYSAAEADGAYLPMITYIEPADALPFVF